MAIPATTNAVRLRLRLAMQTTGHHRSLKIELSRILSCMYFVFLDVIFSSQVSCGVLLCPACRHCLSEVQTAIVVNVSVVRLWVWVRVNYNVIMTVCNGQGRLSVFFIHQVVSQVLDALSILVSD